METSGWFVKFEDGATELVEVGYLRAVGAEDPAESVEEVPLGADAEAQWQKGTDKRFGDAWFPCKVTHVYE